MVSCKVIRTCFFANRLYEVGEEVTFDDSVEIPEHFEVLGGVGKLEADFFEEEKAAPAEVSETDVTTKEEAPAEVSEKDVTTKEEVAPKAATKSKTTSKTKTKK